MKIVKIRSEDAKSIRRRLLLATFTLVCVIAHVRAVEFVETAAENSGELTFKYDTKQGSSHNINNDESVVIEDEDSGEEKSVFRRETMPTYPATMSRSSSTTQSPNFYVKSAVGTSNRKLVISQAHAEAFKHWIEYKSVQLHSLSSNYSGFRLLNETYNIQLSKDARPAWINFTEMIVNISNTISEVLYNKTLVVKSLSDRIEQAFNNYVNNSDRVINSTKHVYYDAKSPKTFCDVAEAYKAAKSSSASTSGTSSSSTTASSGKSSSSSSLSPTSTKIMRSTTKAKSKRRNVNFYEPDFFPVLPSNHMSFYDESNSSIKFDDDEVVEGQVYANPVHIYSPDSQQFHHFHNIDENKATLSLKKEKTNVKKASDSSPPESAVSSTELQSRSTTISDDPTTTEGVKKTDEEHLDEIYDYQTEDQDDMMDDSPAEYNEELKLDFWDVTCMNRTFDENFKSVQKVNRHKSTVQVPINVYKQDMAINMTAYWTEELDELFHKNYDQDNELFWQYFCSSIGLFRRYPAAYWSTSQKDFFDCRLQTWYIMAAASPKDIVLLLDISGSMTGLRLEIGKKLIEFILDTLTDNDFFNVLTFSNTVQFLFHNESDYVDTFVQAGKANKLKYKKALENYKNTSQQARLTDPLKKVFQMFQRMNAVRSNCNKVIMIITDGHADDVDQVFRDFNPYKDTRVFSFKIGRDMTNPEKIRNLACDNNGEYYHVVTLTDINEHVYEYIPVLSRPMALQGVRETTWSNVFIGYLDKELKIAVARPAFSDTSLNYTEFELQNYLNKTLAFKMNNYEELRKRRKKNPGSVKDYYFASEGKEFNERGMIEQAEEEIRKQQVLLGVVGVDVPVLRLISKVSPKYQMGVGIYIIMLDNNGFIVFHPSIKKEIADSAFDYKGSSHSIDIDKFEIPIGNEEQFEQLEHLMIDQETGNMTLDNWKREGLRVIRRRTEYVFTPVSKTPFSVAIASPSSFGRYYIDLPSSRDKDYEADLQKLDKQSFNTTIQLYNCTYSFVRLSERLIMPKQYQDYCIKYLFNDVDQALAIKSDLLIHNIYYNMYNFSMFTSNPNLIKSSFYGTYSGITFYLPVTFIRPKTTSTDDSSSQSNEAHHHTERSAEFETYNMSLNLLSMESNKHTYSFEKQYYTRSIEFSDYLRTEFNRTDDSIVIYFLNETSPETIRETVSATLPIWLQKVPAAVTGVVYDAQKLENILFNQALQPECDPANDDAEINPLCTNICRNTGLTCYLIDEHGILVMTNSEKAILGQPLYKMNPWLMMQLEIEGLFDLIVTGNKLQDCSKPPMIISAASTLSNLVRFVLRLVVAIYMHVYEQIGVYAANFTMSSSTTTTTEAPPVLTAAGKRVQTAAEKFEAQQIEWRIKNSHCFYFGIYSFNVHRWLNRDPTEIRKWCNDTRHYMAGYIRHSNLLMVAVDEENEVTRCGSIEVLAKQRPPSWSSRLRSNETQQLQTSTSRSRSNKTQRRNYSVNRYRKAPQFCHNYYANESHVFFCKSEAAPASKRTNHLLSVILIITCCLIKLF